MKASGAIEAARASRADLAAVARSGCLAATTAASSHRLCRMQAASMQVACQEKRIGRTYPSNRKFQATASSMELTQELVHVEEAAARIPILERKVIALVAKQRNIEQLTCLSAS